MNIPQGEASRLPTENLSKYTFSKILKEPELGVAGFCVCMFVSSYFLFSFLFSLKKKENHKILEMNKWAYFYSCILRRRRETVFLDLSAGNYAPLFFTLYTSINLPWFTCSTLLQDSN